MSSHPASSALILASSALILASSRDFTVSASPWEYVRAFTAVLVALRCVPSLGSRIGGCTALHRCAPPTELWAASLIVNNPARDATAGNRRIQIKQRKPEKVCGDTRLTGVTVLLDWSYSAL